MRKKTLGLMAGIVAATTVVAGCGSGSSDQSSSSSTSSGSVKHGLPMKYASGFTIPIINYPPYSIVSDSGTVSGFDYDIGKALANYFGVSFKTANSTFEDSLLGVKRGTYIYAPATSITPEREKSYDFVSYFKDRYRLTVKSGSPNIGNKVTDLCGKSVATVVGDYTLSYLNKFSNECKAAGKPAIVTNKYPNQSAQVLAVRSGRVDGTALTLANGSYTIKHGTGGLKMTGPEFAVTTEGMALPKGSDLAKPLKNALDALIANGTYGKIMAKYGLQDAAIKQAEINPAAS